MKWLVTFKKHVGREKVVEQLRAMGCEISPSERSMALGDDEELLSVEGPGDLTRLAEPHRATMKVYPNSKMSPW